jgi:AraC-like DNA-binding protein
MKYFTISPPASLRQYVRFFWVLEHDAGKPYVHRSLADGCVELLFHYKGVFKEPDTDEAQPLSLIHPQSDSFKRFIINEAFGIFGVYLYPFAVPALFALPSSDVSNELIDLETFLGFEGKMLEEQISGAADNTARFQILSKYLERRLQGAKNAECRMQEAVKQMIHSRTISSITQFASDNCVSLRQFERKFKELAGFSPKFFSRIIRFQSAANEYGNKSKSLTEIALSCGYYDQSHFIHDFKKFSGYHPSAYFYGRPEGAEYREV